MQPGAHRILRLREEVRDTLAEALEIAHVRTCLLSFQQIEVGCRILQSALVPLQTRRPA